MKAEGLIFGKEIKKQKFWLEESENRKTLKRSWLGHKNLSNEKTMSKMKFKLVYGNLGTDRFPI